MAEFKFQRTFDTLSIYD